MRRPYYGEDSEQWCWECGKACALVENGDERGPFYESVCCGSTDWDDMPPWCQTCGNHTVADWQWDVDGERLCLDCAWSPEGDDE